MLVRDWMTRQVITVSPGTSVLNARRLLHLHGFRHLPVTTGDRLVGIVSDRDIRVTDTALGRSLASLESDLLTGRYRRVESVMVTAVHTVHPDRRVADAAKLMVEHSVGALPVVGSEGLVGIIGLTDCVRALVADRATDGATCAPDATIRSEMHHMLPLTDGDDRPGRPRPKPLALVVAADPTSRLRARNDLTAAGYRVSTCAGPRGGVGCPGVRAVGPQCPRVAAETSLVVLDPDAAPLTPYYERWLPAAEIRIGLPADLMPV